MEFYALGCNFSSLRDRLYFLRAIAGNDTPEFLEDTDGVMTHSRCEAWLTHKNKAGRNRWEVYYEKYLASKQVQAKKTETKNAQDEFRR